MNRFQLVTSVYKALDKRDGKTYCARRIHGQFFY